ncbi:2-amino-4-hydroxy-6-hydroxymethyldihydropteridine diphosphokinase [Flavobacterium seoulense]|uniref:2-amino-4-hydroxy-6-hydroxymethyldihydropteridine pyrophosphokinase n=1 Tax=Flavobacterium seoulense TaxID=1492738 RepID=A0A066WKA2_9FLAO|nr:2-amino-4-hydroxy-6-hydroxymethyldihydropteridine diphosphokinase [Flavobacterium seoulense]KDN54422.1 7,8-dihydro-6-hydroxymethylpterin-pyrophosphokinase [Flavobacterium seoulense]
MKAQHQVILSIGSNQGNRLEIIKECITLIHQEIGTVIQVSRVYETAAWGFSSDAFYNCALVLHTHFSPEEVLSKALAIEKKLGRIRKEEGGYQSRIIDIDMIAFDEATIETETLTVPHPLMQDRKFVLLPFQDLKINWRHPILNKTISELVENCSDTGECVAVADTENPLPELFSNKGFYIAFEGNIGAGKTTLATKIASDFNTKTLFERFAENSFLAKFYKNQERYAFPLELSFLVDRYQQLSATLAEYDLQNDVLVSDYHVFKSLIFAKATLDNEEYELYKNLYEIVYKEIPKPDLYVYLLQNPEELLKNIQKRGRDYEQEITVEYLEKINKAYLDYLNSQTDLNILILDVANRDFVNNQSDYLFILDEIQRRINH